MQPFVSGTVVSPGLAQGKVKIVTDKKSALEVTEEHIVVSKNFLPPLPSLARRAAGFILAGSEADHGVSYLKELWKPAILVDNISQYGEGDDVTIDGGRDDRQPLKDVLPTLLKNGLSSLTLQADRINEVAELVKKAEDRLG